MRTASERQDDAEDEDGNVIEYCGELFQYSLAPRSDTKYVTTIEPCHWFSQHLAGDFGRTSRLEPTLRQT